MKKLTLEQLKELEIQTLSTELQQNIIGGDDEIFQNNNSSKKESKDTLPIVLDPEDYGPNGLDIEWK